MRINSWHEWCFTPCNNSEVHNMKTWSIVAVEVSMAAAGIAMIGLMVVVSFL
jgi:hypothetical protein